MAIHILFQIEYAVKVTFISNLNGDKVNIDKSFATFIECQVGLWSIEMGFANRP